MLSAGGVAAGVVAWLILLFLVALWGERHVPRARSAALIYALSLAIYCTSWTFYGTVAQGANYGWWLPPTFLGTILLYVFGLPFLSRLLSTAKGANATSVADFIASRFGQSSGLAALVTGLVVLGMLPYIALQLKAVAMSYSALVAGRSEPPAWQDSAFYVALIMAAFAMLFGTRRTSASEANRGLLQAMAFEAAFKLLAMLAVGAFVVFAVYQGPLDLHAQWSAGVPASETPRWSAYVTLAFLGLTAMFTLPHQFHVGVVECADRGQLRTARWLFPIFLLLISLPIWPLAAAGQLRLSPLGLAPDLFVLGLPLAEDARTLTLLAFLGGIAAATGMVIMASLSLSIMIGNHWVTPWLLRRQGSVHGWLGDVRRVRRIGIAAVLALGYVYSRALGALDSLAEIGAQSFSALAQLAPAVVLGVYWPRLSPRAIGAGLVAGFAVWAWVLILPLLWPTPFGVGAARFGGIDPLSLAVWSSLAVNLLVLAGVQRFAPGGARLSAGPRLGVDALQPIAQRFLGAERARRLLDDAPAANGELEERVAHELTAVIGAASTRLLLDAARVGSDRQIEQVASLVGEAAQAARFSRQVLAAALENMSQGISVVDAELRLVAWNRRYAELFRFPESLLRVGQPIEDLIRHAQEMLGDADDDPAVDKRLEHLRTGTAHLGERRLPDGTIIEIRGAPMSGGGFLTTFTDVTAFRRSEAELTRIAESLEQRVRERTAALDRARSEAEQANLAKSRLLATITHDLAQPLNAARLFGHSLSRRLDQRDGQADVEHLLGALESAESLLSGLLDISRLGAGAMRARPVDVALQEVLDPLLSEFGVLAGEKGLRLRCVPTRAWVHSDPQLLRRVLQNFLANAVRYTERGRLLLGVRRVGDALRVEVWDQGPGIAREHQQVIFEEFRRLDRGGRGLGLGLAIAERIAQLLGSRVELRSWPGKGSVFALRVPRVAARPLEAVAAPAVEHRASLDLSVWVLDNDPAVAAGMRALLEGWGCRVRLLGQRESLHGHIAPDAVLLDYHLDDNVTGLALRRGWPPALRAAPCVLITADHDPAIRQEAEAEGCQVLYKPLKPLALRSLLRRWASAQRH
ncbi:PAS domain-containing hybrid sensor histidine kinase/response regulator [Pseudomarimonas salicorniae]|uniref:histidine kinase n=1 Tax=Pseudomarimonas salicorniae TaxID=2933270 RepID=A0ABT0GKV4_9GAMM|nr:PAS-domain containing protein [Lysobacter sp. CAU 1642]MCK7594660.1 PAS-domain containing protein [Lysobacter sp. CAU 1642]